MVYLNKKNYIPAQEIIEKCPKWCKNIKNGREFLRRKNIDKTNFIYARLVDGEWVETDGASTKSDKVLVRQKYLNTCQEYLDEIDGDDSEDLYKILELTDDEKIKDDNGDIHEIEVRGTRHYNNIFFNGKNVASLLQMKFLIKTLKDSRNEFTYEEGVDYKMLKCADGTEELYLTYLGMLRVFFVSRNKNAQNFVGWMSNLLFLAHLGTPEEKKEICSKIMGISLDTLKTALKASTKDMSCVYLYTLGKVKDLRESMTIANDYGDEMIVCKYGNSTDLHRRTVEHSATYGAIPNVDLKLKLYTPVDPEYVFDAENDLKNTFQSMNAELKFKNYVELVVVKPTSMKTIEAQYEMLGKMYSGYNKDVIIQTEKMKTMHEKIETEIRNECIIIKKNCDMELMKMRNELEMIKKNHELEMALKNKELSQKDVEFKLVLAKKDSEIAQKDNELALAKKDIELERMKCKLILYESKS